MRHSVSDLTRRDREKCHNAFADDIFLIHFVFSYKFHRNWFLNDNWRHSLTNVDLAHWCIFASYQYRKSHCGDKTILRPSYLHNGISYTGKTISLYWIGARWVWFRLYSTQLCSTGVNPCPAHGTLPRLSPTAVHSGNKPSADTVFILVLVLIYNTNIHHV